MKEEDREDLLNSHEVAKEIGLTIHSVYYRTEVTALRPILFGRVKYYTKYQLDILKNFKEYTLIPSKLNFLKEDQL